MLIYFQNKKYGKNSTDIEKNLVKSKLNKKGNRVRFKSNTDLILGSMDSQASTIVT